MAMLIASQTFNTVRHAGGYTSLPPAVQRSSSFMKLRLVLNRILNSAT